MIHDLLLKIERIDHMQYTSMREVSEKWDGSPEVFETVCSEEQECPQSKMDRYTFDGKNGLWYELVGEIYLPCITAPVAPVLGHWGKLRRCHLREHRNGIYTGMLLSGKLGAHLTEIDTQAEAMFTRLVNDMAQKEGVTEGLKVIDQMSWVQQMNSIRSRAAEIVREELIFA